MQERNLSRRTVIDGLLIQPIEAQRVFSGPNGEQITLTYNTLTGQFLCPKSDLCDQHFV